MLHSHVSFSSEHSGKSSVVLDKIILCHFIGKYVIFSDFGGHFGVAILAAILNIDKSSWKQNLLWPDSDSVPLI